MPGFVDAHTHPVFAGIRANEFEQRSTGATYREIAARGRDSRHGALNEQRVKPTFLSKQKGMQTGSCAAARQLWSPNQAMV